MNRRIMKKKHKKQILQEIFRICKSPFSWAVIHTGKNINIFSVKELSIIKRELWPDLLLTDDTVLVQRLIPEYDVNFVTTNILNVSRKEYEQVMNQKIKMWRDD